MIEKRTHVDAETHAIAAGHDLATQAGLAVLEDGGNAVDAGVAAGIALGVLHSDLVNFAGVAPIMIRIAETGEVVTIDGLGVWPRTASVEFFEREFGGAIPTGILRTVVPAAPAAWIKALSTFGTMTLGDVASFAVRYAREGFPVYPLFADFIRTNQDAYRRHAASAEIYLPNGHPPEVGQLFRQSDLAGTVQYMIDQETAAGGDRRAGLKAARDAFYKGDIARTIAAYHTRNHGFLAYEDLASFDVRFETPLTVPFGEIDIYTCGAWCQGISFAETMGMLNRLDIGALEQNSSRYIHTLTEAFKLVFADREAFVADPSFVEVPVDGLLEPAYLAERCRAIDPDKASPEMPKAGAPSGVTAEVGNANQAVATALEQSDGDPHDTGWKDEGTLTDPASADTSYVAVIDRDGNMFSATPSDTSADTVVIPGTGLCPSSRGSQSRGNSRSINSLAPGKRPRLTPNPALAIQNGKPLLAFGTPGGDVQIQAMAQVFLNIFVHGMNVQDAVQAPRFATYSFPSSFAPNAYHANLLTVEDSIPDETAAELLALGHKVERWPDGTWKAGGVLAVHRHPETGRILAGADPRRAGTARGR
ncbi:gamma-glutamyltransferase family protein [Denitrobaculum tricleocarpae]|uniref:Gamma-glutamyltransferase family protein n=1 Tax=Denitrobaculum tricleocarpae TaxID=2591009 RepID=A0A545TX47_9PROT|nr:gamma-glutamyltransferase [Denitrobaculum tricleocarpae]TQV81764.1 gamma-glutamyltransferase family protein [Denitrobaculum tricleocarpae]